MPEYVCEDCGRSLEDPQGFVAVVCPECGRTNAISRRDYENTSRDADAVDLWVSEGFEGVVLSRDGEVRGDEWVHCKNPSLVRQ
jgi:predicted RNA-binding Zn-ribbon protein involved in translation (DUF1610 family)